MKMNMGMMKRTFGSLRRGGGGKDDESMEAPKKMKMKSKNPPRKFVKKG